MNKESHIQSSRNSICRRRNIVIATSKTKIAERKMVTILPKPTLASWYRNVKFMINGILFSYNATTLTSRMTESSIC